MMKNKKFLALVLASTMVVSLTGCGGDSNKQTTQGSTEPTTSSTTQSTTSTQGGDTSDQEYVYKDAVSVLSANWNPHTYQTVDDGYLLDYVACGFYEPVYNDELHPVEGLEPYAGYKFIPSMAASDPVDVTEKIKAEHPEFGIPESASEGYAYTIDLNQQAQWADGTPINADSYIYSMKELLNPKANNYRATDYYNGEFVIVGAEAYANSGKRKFQINSEDGETMAYALADLVKGEDGTYSTAEGYPVFFGLNESYAWMGGKSLNDYHSSGHISDEVWNVLSEAADAQNYCPVTDETIAALYQFTGSDTWGNEPQEQLGYYMSVAVSYYPEVDFSSVGLFKSGDYQITIVFSNSLSGFNLYYNLSTPTWLVKEDLYEANKKINGEAYSSTYNSSVETSSSYGPYKLVEFQSDKALRLEKNENWFGYTDGQHTYKDPTDGQVYDMWQSTAIECQVVAESATHKMMFLKGELMTYGLGADDFDTYRNSEYAFATPKTTTFFFIINGYMDAIKNREASSDFDKTKYDLETMTLKSFKQALAVTYDKELFAGTISPSRKGGYGLIGTTYVYNPSTGAKYRDTDQARQVLCDFYSVDTSKFSSLEEAVKSITGFDPEEAKVLYKQAFDEALAAGFITDQDGDGISDQTVRIEYAMSTDPNDFLTKTINYLNEKMKEVTAGTPFDGKIEFVMSANYGNEWSNKLRSGLADTALAGWSGSSMNPFDVIRLYTNGTDQQYDGKWFDASKVDMTLELNGESITMNLRQWSEALLGTTITKDGKDYNFGEAFADVDTRLTILASLEGQILQTYNYIPMLEDASMGLLTQQAYYVVDDFSPLMSRGGIQYLKYNYSESEWAAYVTEQGGELKY